MDNSEFMPKSVRKKLAENLILHCEELGKRHLNDDAGIAIGKLRNDNNFLEKFNYAVDTAIKQFVDAHIYEEEDLILAILADKDFWSYRSIINALDTLLKRPKIFSAASQKSYEFSDLLPKRLNRDKVNRIVTYFFQFLNQAIWSIDDLQPIIQLQSRFTEGRTENSDSHVLDTRSSPIRNNLPNPDYTEFIGRDNEFKKLIDLLRPYPLSVYHLISIDGIGGVGKTALTLMVAHHFVREFAAIDPSERFDAVVWTSAKRNILTSSGIVNREQALRNIGDIYAAIAHTLDRPDVLSSNVEQQDSLVRNILAKNRILIIVDNLETVEDLKVINFLRELPAPTKAIVTTRRRTIEGSLPIRIKGLEKNDVLSLVEQECSKKNVTLSSDQKQELAKKTAGVPLAIVWTIGQIYRGYPPEKALLRLSSANKDYAKFVFSESLELLRQDNKTVAIKLLLSLSLFADGATRDALGFVSGIGRDDDERDESLTYLLDLSLINYENGRFSILPLTKEYSDAELYQDREFQSIAMDRLFEWHVLLAEKGGGGKLDLDASILDMLKIEHTNVLWVVNASFTHERFDIYVKLLRGMGFFWMGTGYWNDYENYYNKGRMLAPEPIDRIHFAVRLIWLNILRQDFDKANAMLNYARELLKDYPNRYEEMRFQDYSGQLKMEMGELEEAEEHLKISLRIAGEIMDRRGQFACLKYLGELYCRRGNSTRARELLLEAEPYAAGTGEDQWIRGLAHAAQLRGLIGLIEGKWADAASAFNNCLEYLSVWPDERLLTRAKIGLAYSKNKMGNEVESSQLLEENNITFTKLGMPYKVIPVSQTLSLWKSKNIVGFWESM